MKIRIDASDPEKMTFRKRYHRMDPRPNLTISVLVLGDPKDAIVRGLEELDKNVLVLMPKTT